jgi:DNA-repair protein XRCC1
VVAVISGIPLPERATLRDKVIAMGGTYSPNWHSGCTHLIAAFTGTPKYTQALDSGAYIVTKQWVYECSQQKTRLAETHFKLSTPSLTLSQSGIFQFAFVFISLIFALLFSY